MTLCHYVIMSLALMSVFMCIVGICCKFTSVYGYSLFVYNISIWYNRDLDKSVVHAQNCDS